MPRNVIFLGALVANYAAFAHFIGMSTAATPEQMRESASGFDRIDRDQGVIRGVRVLGLNSKNGRRYLREAVKKAVSLYEGAKVYLNHAAPHKAGSQKVEASDRLTKERWGKLVNVREDADGGLVADLEYLKTHSETESILEAAERFRDIGLSHDTMGRSRIEDGERVVYEIVKVNSVDLVENPATTETLWESQMAKSKRNYLTVLRENRAKSPVADGLLRHYSEMADDPEKMKEMGMELDDMEVEVDKEMTGEDAVKMGLRQAIMAVIDGEGDLAEKMKRVKMLLGAGEKIAAPTTQTAESVQKSIEAGLSSLTEQMRTAIAPGLEAIGEAVKRVESLEQALADSQSEEACRKLLESKNREVTEDRLRLLAGVEVASREALVESWAELRVKPSRSLARHQSPGTPAATRYQEVRKNLRALQTK